MATKVEKKSDRKKRRDEELGFDENKNESLKEIRESRKMKNWSSEKWRWFVVFYLYVLIVVHFYLW